MLSPLITAEFENEILELFDNQDMYTRSDLQGIVTALVNRILENGYRIISELKNEK